MGVARLLQTFLESQLRNNVVSRILNSVVNWLNVLNVIDTLKDCLLGILVNLVTSGVRAVGDDWREDGEARVEQHSVVQGEQHVLNWTTDTSLGEMLHGTSNTGDQKGLLALHDTVTVPVAKVGCIVGPDTVGIAGGVHPVNPAL